MPRFCRSVNQISTDEVYGSRVEGSLKETDALNPSSPHTLNRRRDKSCHDYRYCGKPDGGQYEAP